MWDPAHYDNITDTRLPWQRVWTPDIVLYNAAGDGEQGREMRTLIQVDYQGNVTLLTQAIYMSKCKVVFTLCSFSWVPISSYFTFIFFIFLYPHISY